MLNELNIRIFLSLAETLNFTEVGKMMFISQQAVSKHIAGLEKDLEVKLLLRSRNKVELTKAGLEYYNFFRTFIDQYDSLRERLCSNLPDQMQTIRIGYQNWVDFGPAPGNAMAALRQDYPDLYLLGERHSPAKLLQLLDSGALEMVLLHKRFIQNAEGFEKKALITTPMQMVLSLHNRIDGDNISLRDYRKMPVLIDAFEGESIEEAKLRARREIKPYDFDPIEIVVVPNRDSIYTAAELGRGVFFSSAMTILNESASLIRYDTPVNETLYCVWREREDSVSLARYAKLLQREYKRMEAHYLKYRNWDLQ